VQRFYKKKVERFYANIQRTGAACGFIDEALLDKHLKKWSQLQKRVNPKWYIVYTMTSGFNCIDYVPTNIYVLNIEPVLNDHRLAPVYTNKSTYHMLFDPCLFPEVIVNNINGTYYDRGLEHIRRDHVGAILSAHDRVVVKPSIDSGGGNNVQVFSRDEGKHRNRHGEELTLEYLAEHYGRDFVVQQYIEQLDYFRRLNESSVNTVRVYTYRSVRTGKVNVENLVVRVGQPGSEVDNFREGGMACKIDTKGKYGRFAVDGTGNRHTLTPDGGLRFADLPPVPQIDKICKTAVVTAEKLHSQRVIAFDICINNKGEIKVIEINTCGVEINFHQFSNGGLFHEHTDEVIEYCIKWPRTPLEYKGNRAIYL
jgi:hypothetical protein